MKFRTLIFSLIALSFIATLVAESTKVQGCGQYGQVKLESLNGTGLIKLNGTSVNHEISLVGSLISQNGEIGSLDVTGEVNLTETTVKKGGTIIGSMQTVRSTIQEPITILSQKAVFTSSKLAGITVKQDSAFKGKQIIELRQRTLVDGPIHFESGKGEVLIYTGSQVLGPVTGGKVIKDSNRK
jgi:hypothetical protein